MVGEEEVVVSRRDLVFARQRDSDPGTAEHVAAFGTAALVVVVVQAEEAEEEVGESLAASELDRVEEAAAEVDFEAVQDVEPHPYREAWVSTSEPRVLVVVELAAEPLWHRKYSFVVVTQMLQEL